MGRWGPNGGLKMTVKLGDPPLFHFTPFFPIILFFLGGEKIDRRFVLGYSRECVVHTRALIFCVWLSLGRNIPPLSTRSSGVTELCVTHAEGFSQPAENSSTERAARKSCEIRVRFKKANGSPSQSREFRDSRASSEGDCRSHCCALVIFRWLCNSHCIIQRSIDD